MVSRLVAARERETFQRTRPVIEKRGGTSQWDGTAFAPDGQKFTGLNSDATKEWVEFDSSTNTFVEFTGTPTVPWPEFKTYWRKVGLAGDIVVQRL